MILGDVFNLTLASPNNPKRSKRYTFTLARRICTIAKKTKLEKNVWTKFKKQGFVTEFEFIDNTSVNRNISNLNARNIFELVEKDNSKYFLYSSYNLRINT